MPGIAKLSQTALQEISNILGDTHTGLTGSEIGSLLDQCSIHDVVPGGTKGYRLYEALLLRQEQDGCSNNVMNFISTSMDPVRYHDNPERFEARRSQLNKVLSFQGYELLESGELRLVKRARTLSEAEQRAGRLQAKLRERKVHGDLLRFCRAELLHNNYFHAVFEATKSVAEKIRNEASLSSDGSRLIDEAFGFQDPDYPILAINSLQTPTEVSEHRGFMNLCKGMFGMFRNVTAHVPKISWPIGEQDALDLLTLASLLHRKLDEAVRTKPLSTSGRSQADH